MRREETRAVPREFGGCSSSFFKKFSIMVENIKIISVDSDSFRKIVWGKMDFVIKPCEGDYKVGDVLLIREFRRNCVGGFVVAGVVGVVDKDEGLKEGYRVLSFEVVWRYQVD